MVLEDSVTIVRKIEMGPDTQELLQEKGQNPSVYKGVADPVLSGPEIKIHGQEEGT